MSSVLNGSVPMCAPAFAAWIASLDGTRSAAAAVTEAVRLGLSADRARQLIEHEFSDVTDDEMKLIDAKYDDRAKALQAHVWSLAESK